MDSEHCRASDGEAVSDCALCLGKGLTHSDTCPLRVTATAALLEHIQENEEELTQGELTQGEDKWTEPPGLRRLRKLQAMACSCGTARSDKDPALRAAGNSTTPNVFVFATQTHPFEVRACRGCGVVYVPAEVLARAP